MSYTVYRIESKEDNRGPFNTHDGFSLSILSHDWGRYIDAELFPSVRIDFNDFFSLDTDNVFTGVLFPCQLYFWFGPDFDIILSHFGIYKIEVSEYLLGNSGSQVLFKKQQIISKELLIK